MKEDQDQYREAATSEKRKLEDSSISILLAKQKAQEIAARLVSDAESKRPRLEEEHPHRYPNASHVDLTLCSRVPDASLVAISNACRSCLRSIDLSRSNCFSGIGLLSLAANCKNLVEGMIFAHKSGLDVGLFLDAIKVGAAGSKSLDLHGGRILKRDLEPGFYVNHFVKDLGICLKECQKMELALPGLALAQHGVTRSSDMTLAEFRKSQLGLRGLKLPADATEAPILPTENLPEDFDWREHGAVTAVKKIRVRADLAGVSVPQERWKVHALSQLGSL